MPISACACRKMRSTRAPTGIATIQTPKQSITSITKSMRRFPSRLRHCAHALNMRLQAHGDAGTRNGITTAVVTPFLDDAGKQRTRPLAIVPAFSVMLEPGTQVISTHNGSTSTVAVGVTSNLDERSSR